MPIKLENKKLIREFLFGELPEQERLELEEKFITDAKFFEEIKVVEDELIEKYVRRWMDSAENSKFEQNFLTTKKRRAGVEFSRRMISKLQEQRAEIIAVKKNDAVISEESVWQKLAGLFLTPKTAMAAAFSMLIIVFGSWFLYQNMSDKKTEIVKNQNSEILENPKQIITPTPDISPEKLAKNVENNIEDVNNKQDENLENKPSIKKTPKKSNEKIKKIPTPTKTPQIKKSAPNPVLALFAGTLRSAGETNELNLPKNAKGANLQLNLESVDYKNYQAALTDAGGNVIYQKSNLKPKKSQINFFIPSKNLNKGDYIIKLYGKNDSGKNESAADFQFRVNQ